MSKKYWYGEKDRQVLTDNNLFDFIKNKISDKEFELVIYQYEIDHEAEDFYCKKNDSLCDSKNCFDKSFIGKSHICEYRGHWLKETGAIWIYNHQGGSLVIKEKIKQITKRME